MKIGSHVRETREALGLKQQDLADQVQVTSQHISRIELDQTAPSVETLLKLSQKLGDELRAKNCSSAALSRRPS